MRAGGGRVWGRYLFHEAAFLGGFSTVRGLPAQRYAGDAALYGNAELRLRPAGFLGVFALVDTGRVFLEGESSRRWHTGLGGGAWVAFLDKTFALTVARSEGPHALLPVGRISFLRAVPSVTGDADLAAAAWRAAAGTRVPQLLRSDSGAVPPRRACA